MTFGFPQGLTKQELSDAYFAHYQKTPKHIPPVFVDDGPVFENIVKEDDVDIEKFPTPVWHANDGGRYIGTGCYSVTMDPDEKWINAGCYRAMIQDKKTREPADGAGQAWLHAPGKIFPQRREDADRAGDRRRSAVFLHGRHRASLRRVRVRHRRRHAPQAGGSACAARSPVCRFPANSEIVFEGFLEQRQSQVRRSIRRVDRLLRFRRERAAGARDRSDLSSQRSDHSRRAADRRRLGRDGALPRDHALGHAQATTAERRRAGRDAGVGA